MSKHLIGETYGKLTVIEKSESKLFKNGIRYGKTRYKKTQMWKCKCDCGKETIVSESNLIKNNTKSCGCSRVSNIRVGDTYGKLKILNKEHVAPYFVPRLYGWWKASCECGNTIIVRTSYLTSGDQKSCGKCCRYHKFKLDEHYFDIIDSEEKAYILGFAIADGCVISGSHGYGLCFELHIKDKLHLEKIKNCIVSDYILAERTRKSFHSCMLRISSKIMTEVLINKYNILPNKSHVGCKIPKTIPEHLMHHLIRGIFDGDGSAGQNASKNDFYFNIVGHLDLISDIQEVICKEVGLNKTKIMNRKNKKWGYMQYRGNGNGAKLYNYLYKDATIFLERKKEKFPIIKNESI